MAVLGKQFYLYQTELATYCVCISSNSPSDSVSSGDRLCSDKIQEKA